MSQVLDTIGQRLPKWPLQLTLAGAALLLVATATGCGLLFEFDCKDEVRTSLVSPGGALVASAFTRNCGATTGLTTQLNLRKSSEKFDGDTGVVLVVEGDQQVSLEWMNASTLSVECAGCGLGRVFRRDTRWGDVRISY